MKGFVIAVSVALTAFVVPACAQSTTSAKTSVGLDPVTADASHYSVLFENDIARVLRIKYPPGAKSVMHPHPATCQVFLTDGTFKSTLPAVEPALLPWLLGVSPAERVQTKTHPAGEVWCGDAYSHLPENPGTMETELVLLELKRRDTFDDDRSGKSINVFSGPNVLDAIAVNSAHYSVEFENDAVRLLRIKLGAGESAGMHAHPAYCTIELTDSTIKDSVGQPAEAKARDVRCGDAMAHAPKDVGKTLAETVVIEFKNHRTFRLK